MDIAISKNEVPIRLTIERWSHIAIGPPELTDCYYEILESVEEPEVIYEENQNAKIAVKKIERDLTKFVVVVYKEISDKDGFVITAYLTDKMQTFQSRRKLWETQK